MVEGTDLYDYFLCPYKVYNKYNRDRKLMLPFSDFSKKLMELGREHEKEVVSHIKFARPKYKFGDLEDGFQQTLKLMKKGEDFIYQGILKYKSYLGMPDLLIKQKGKSDLGNFFYVPADVKSSTRSKEEQIMQLMFYSMLLEKSQGKEADKGLLILKKSSELIDLEKYKDKFENALVKIDLICKGLDFGMHIDSVCRDCPWREVCIPLAQKTKDISLVYGLSRPSHYRLAEAGLKTLNDLKKADAAKIAEMLDMNESSIEKWKRFADVLITKKEKINKVDLPETKNHICLDIETTEDGKVYLIGLWYKNKFKYFFSEKDEKKIVDDFVEFLLGLNDYILYHYGSFEKTTFKRLFEEYKINEDTRRDIFERMIDLLQIVKKNAILPLSFYNLKEVAKHFGFKWRSSDASGGNSMVWYDEWLETKNPKILKKMLEYNEDDVHGTFIILKKIANNLK